MTLTWTTAAGASTALRIAPASCAPPGALVVGAVAADGLQALTVACPDVGASLEGVLAALAIAPVVPTADGAALGRPAPRAGDASPVEMFWVRTVLPATWAALLVLMLLWAARTVRSLRLDSTTASVAAAVVVGAALRLLWAEQGPGDIINTVEEAYLGAGGLSGIGLYGRGVEGLLLLLFAVLPAGDDTVIALDLCLGLLSVPAVAWFAGRLGYEPRIGSFAAWLLAVAPLHVRFSATVNRYILLVFLVLMGWGWLLGWLRDHRRLELALATLALSVAAQCRPDAVPLVPVLTLALVGAWWWPRRGSWRPRPALGLAVAAAALLAALPLWRVASLIIAEPYGNTGPLMGARELFAPMHNAFLAQPYTPALWGLAAVFGLRRPPAGDRWLLAWLVLAALLPTWLASVWSVDPNLNTARYHLLPLPFYVLVAAAGWSWLEGPRARLAAVVLVLFATVPLRTTLTPRMMNDEYRFLRTHLPAVPDGCSVFTLAPAAGEDLGLRPGIGVSVSAGRQHHWSWDLNSALGANPGCVAYYDSGSCNLHTGRREDRLQPACTALRDRARGVIATARVTDSSSEGRPVVRVGTTVGLYWMVGPPP